MFDSRKVLESIYKFTGKVKRDENGKVQFDADGKVVYEGGNPIWRKVYREAPPLAKRRLVLSWYYSMNKDEIIGNGELNDEFVNVKKAMDKTLGKEDLEFLIANLGNNAKAVEHYKELLANLQGGEEQTQEAEAQQQQTQEGDDGESHDGENAEGEETGKGTDAAESESEQQSDAAEQGEEASEESAQQQTV